MILFWSCVCAPVSVWWSETNRTRCDLLAVPLCRLDIQEAIFGVDKFSPTGDFHLVFTVTGLSSASDRSLFCIQPSHKQQFCCWSRSDRCRNVSVIQSGVHISRPPISVKRINKYNDDKVNRCHECIETDATKSRSRLDRIVHGEVLSSVGDGDYGEPQVEKTYVKPVPKRNNPQKRASPSQRTNDDFDERNADHGSEHIIDTEKNPEKRGDHQDISSIISRLARGHAHKERGYLVFFFWVMRRVFYHECLCRSTDQVSKRKQQNDISGEPNAFSQDLVTECLRQPTENDKYIGYLTTEGEDPIQGHERRGSVFAEGGSGHPPSDSQDVISDSYLWFPRHEPYAQFEQVKAIVSMASRYASFPFAPRVQIRYTDDANMDSCISFLNMFGARNGSELEQRPVANTD